MYTNKTPANLLGTTHPGPLLQITAVPLHIAWGAAAACTPRLLELGASNVNLLSSCGLGGREGKARQGKGLLLTLLRYQILKDF